MSYPERVIQGVNCRLGLLWDGAGGNKNGPLFASSPDFLSLGAAVCSVGTADAGFGHPAD